VRAEGADDLEPNKLGPAGSGTVNLSIAIPDAKRVSLGRLEFSEIPGSIPCSVSNLPDPSRVQPLVSPSIFSRLRKVPPMPNPLAITQVDAFTDRPFAGNPAAVCVLPRPVDPSWMQSVANEMNLAETAFLVAEPDGGYGLRWFTPLVEVDLCGHATLASAHVLWESGLLPRSSVARFSTRSGLLTATLGEGGWISLDFPSLGTTTDGVPPVDAVALALGLASASGVVEARMSRFDLLVEVESAQLVRASRPDFGLLALIEVRGVIVTARADAEAMGADFVSRFFAPRTGVAEDPVTGSAHCVLGPYWGEKLGQTTLVGAQLSDRGGVVRVGLVGDRVHLGGQAVTVLRGELVGRAGAL